MFLITITSFDHNLGYNVSKVFYVSLLVELKEMLTRGGFQKCGNHWVKDEITAEVEPVAHLCTYFL